MEPIAEPDSNKNHPIEVSAQTIASQAGWQMEAGQVFDGRGVFVASSLTELAEAMLAEDWIYLTAHASGVNWPNLPHKGSAVDHEAIASGVQAAVRQLQAAARGLA